MNIFNSQKLFDKFVAKHASNQKKKTKKTQAFLSSQHYISARELHKSYIIGNKLKVKGYNHCYKEPEHTIQ